MNHYHDAAKFLLRLTIGLLLLPHGLAKLANGVAGIGGMLAAKGLPTFLAYGAYLGEVLGPVLLVLGICTRPAALIVVVHMVVAILLAHTHELTKFAASGAWNLELQALFLFGALTIALQGAGRYSLGHAAGRYN